MFSATFKILRVKQAGGYYSEIRIFEKFDWIFEDIFEDSFIQTLFRITRIGIISSNHQTIQMLIYFVTKRFMINHV